MRSQEPLAGGLAEHRLEHLLGVEPAAIEGIERGTVAEHDHPRGEPEEFLDLGRQVDHRSPFLGETRQVLVEFGLGADVDAARRVIENDDVRAHGETATDQHFLLVAAG